MKKKTIERFNIFNEQSEKHNFETTFTKYKNELFKRKKQQLKISRKTVV